MTNQEITCPECGGPVWDNRPKKAAGEFSPKSPDFKCKDKKCTGVIWPGETVETHFKGEKKPLDYSKANERLKRPVNAPESPPARQNGARGSLFTEYAGHAGRAFAAAWEESKNAMALIPTKDAEELTAFQWLDLRLRIAQGFAIEINKIIRKERF